MKIITTVSGDEVKIDDAFYGVLSRKRWYTIKGPGRTSYARTYHKGEHLYMHRLLMNEPEGMSVDHIDGDGLNNQRSNLQIVTQAENVRLGAERRKIAILYDEWKASCPVEDEGVYEQ